MGKQIKAETPPCLPVYTIVPGGKYVTQGRPSYAHIYRDGTLCHATNGQHCMALAQAWMDEHDPIKQAVRAGMLTKIHPCLLWPEKCAYAQRDDIVCLRKDAVSLAPGKTWYVCRGVTNGEAVAEVTATREDKRTPGEVRCPRISADVPSWICGRCKGGC